MKKYVKFSMIVASVLIMNACNKDPLNPDENSNNTNKPISLECDIRQSLTLTDRNPLGVDYIVDCQAYVFNGTLAIEPGTTLQFNDGASLSILETGVIKANGTAQNQIKFTNNGGNIPSWAGIFIYTDGVGNSISHAIIEKAGAATSLGLFNEVKGALIIEESKVNVTNNQIINSGDAGIVILNEGEFTTFTNNTIRGSVNFPMVVDAEQVGTIDYNANTYTNNGKEYIEINSPQRVENYIEKPIVITKAPIPYFISKKTFFYKTTEIMAGTEFVFAENATLAFSAVDTPFRILGTPTNHVIMKGLKAQSGFWGGILIETKGDKYQFDYLDISDGGALDHGYGTLKGNIKLAGFGQAVLSMNNCTSTRSGSCDVVLDEYWDTKTLQNNNSGNLNICKE